MDVPALKQLDEGRFWRIVAASLDGTDGVGLARARQTRLLEHELERLSHDESVGFAAHFCRHFGNACRWDLWAVAHVLMDGCSDDGFTDFRKWLIMRGEPVYRAALRDPDSLCDEFAKIPRGEIPMWEYYLETQFDSRFGEEAFGAMYERQGFAAFGPNEIRDPENRWEADDRATIAGLCPKVFAKWSDNGRF